MGTRVPEHHALNGDGRAHGLVNAVHDVSDGGMAVALAESNGGLTPNVVAAANNTVANFAGMPILTAAPSFAQEGGEAKGPRGGGAEITSDEHTSKRHSSGVIS